MEKEIYKPDSDIGTQLAKNSLSSILVALVACPLTLILTFYTVKYLGKVEFGIWTLVGVVASYAQLGDFVTTESLVKFIAEHKARNEIRQLNQFINTSIVINAIISIFLCLLFIMFLPFIVNSILHIPGNLQHKTIYILRIAIIVFFVNMITRVFGSLIIGFQRMDYSNVILILLTVITTIGSLLFLYNGYGLIGLTYNTVIATVILVGANIFVAWRLFPQMRINPVAYFSREALQQIFKFGWKVQLSNISQLMVFRIDTVLLSHYVGLTAVSYYEVANRVASLARGVIILIFMPLMPAASAIDVCNNDAIIRGLYTRSLKYLSVILAPFSFLIIAIAHPFIRTWMGPGYEISALTLQLLMVIYMVNLLTGPGSLILCGINKPHIGMKSALLTGVLNVFFCVMLVKLTGYYGMILGILTAMLIGASYFIWMVHQVIHGLNWSIYPQNLVRPVVYAAFSAAILMTLNAIFQFKGYVILTMLGIFYLVINFACALRYKNYFDDYDRSIFFKIIPFRPIKL